MNPLASNSPSLQTVLHTKVIKAEDFVPNHRTDFYLPIAEGALGIVLHVPFIVARGAHSGPTIGLTAAVHGNELNGIRIIHSLLKNLDLSTLSGTIVCAPIVSVPAYFMAERRFSDGVDLNNSFPGKADGTPSEQYAKAFVDSFLPSLDYLVDIHTASEGRLNSLYVRVNIESSEALALAVAFNPDIILNSAAGEATLRNAARARGISAITVEAGNPSVIQGRMVFAGELGIRSVMAHLNMLEEPLKTSNTPVVCKSSKWLRTTGGGLVEPRFKLLQRIQKDEILLEAFDPFGNVTKTYQAPSDGIVIGMAANPLAIAGTRYCHLGFLL
jgi:predicted deacylase